MALSLDTWSRECAHIHDVNWSLLLSLRDALLEEVTVGERTVATLQEQVPRPTQLQTKRPSLFPYIQIHQESARSAYSRRPVIR
jgi:hypothetical protein